MKTIVPLLLLLAINALLIVIAVKSSNRKSGGSYRGNQECRMLCRSRSNRAIAGVCGGIAEYFGWNATAVRLFFILSGVGLLSYVILAIVIPDSPSSLL